MEKDNGKVITVSFVIAGFLAALIFEVIETVLATHIGAVARWRAIAAVQHGLPVLAGFVTFLGLQLNPKVVRWADEVVAEVRKVVWPSRKETVAMTFVCCMMLLFAGLWFGFFDYVSGNFVKMIVKM